MSKKKIIKVRKHKRDADSNSNTPKTPVKEHVRRPKNRRKIND